MSLHKYRYFFMPFVSLIFGAIISVAPMIIIQTINNKQDTLRSLYSLAYQSAMDEWKTRLNLSIEVPDNGAITIPSLQDILVEHFSYAAIIYESDPEQITQSQGKHFRDRMAELYYYKIQTTNDVEESVP